MNTIITATNNTLTARHIAAISAIKGSTLIGSAKALIIEEEKYTEDEEGTEGHYIKPIHVKYRPYFQKEGNVIYHFISLTSNEDCDNATVEIIVKGDEDKDKDMIFIESVSPGVPFENKVTGLLLVKGQKVLLKVKFEDNLLHSLSLKAYEDKR